MATPTRTCIGCHQAGPAPALVRLAVHPITAALVVDYSGKLPGRGAWIHPARPCIQRAERHPARLQRTLKATFPTKGLGAALRAANHRAVRDGLSLAAASGALVSGHDRLAMALAEHRVCVVATACDASPRTLHALRAHADPSVDFVPLPLTRAQLGDQLGSRGERAAVGVLASRKTKYLVSQLRRLPELG